MLDDDVWRYLPMGPAPTLAVAVLCAVIGIYMTLSRSRAARATAVALLVGAVLVVLASTARGSIAHPGDEFSWRLGESIRAELHSPNRALGLVNVLGNILLFLPIGWAVAVLAVRRPVLTGALAALALSGMVETWQMLSGSFGDVDDLLLNGLGGLLGATAATALLRLGRLVQNNMSNST